MTRTAFGATVVLALLLVTSTFAAHQLPDLSHWKSVLSFRPSTAVQKKVKDRGADWAVHRIEDAVGDVNCDIYSVHVAKLPKEDGHEMKPNEVLEHIRQNLNAFVDPTIAHFRPFDDAEKMLWESDNPTGAILLIDMKIFGVANPDSGCVVTTKRSRNEWVFSTIRAGGPKELFGDPAVAHPVSGNRAFGVYKTTSGTFVFYNVAADRPTRDFDNVANVIGILPASQKRLWKTFQENVVKYINDHGGEASLGRSDAKSHKWRDVHSSPYYDVSDQPKWE